MNLFEFYNYNSESNRTLNVPTALGRLFKSIHHSAPYPNHSRTLAHIHNETIARHGYDWYASSNSNVYSIYHLLSTCCQITAAMLNGETSIRKTHVQFHYLSPVDVNAQSYITMTAIPGTSTDNLLNLIIIYAPRNKTILKEKIKDAQPNEIPQLNTLLIETPNHFVKTILKNNNTIIIFTDYITKRFVNMLYACFPKLLQALNMFQKINNPNQSETITKYNQALSYTLELHRIMFDSLNQDTNKATDKARITEILTALSTLWINPEALHNTFIKNFANRRNQIAKRSLEDSETRYKNEISRYEDSLRNMYEALAETQRKKLSLKDVSADDVLPFLNALKNNPLIETLDTTNDRLTLRITAPLQYYDPEDYKYYITNKNSKVNTYFNDIEKEILYDTFINKKYGIILEAIIHITIVSDLSIGALEFRAQSSSPSQFKNIPNPHLYYYNCWSEARNVLAKAIANNDYEIIIPQMIAAVQSVNVAESASFSSHFLDDLNSSTWRSKINFIEYATQTKYTFETLIEQYKQAKIEKIEKEAMQKAQETIKIDTLTSTDNAQTQQAMHNTEYTQIVISENDEGDEE